MTLNSRPLVASYEQGWGLTRTKIKLLIYRDYTFFVKKEKQKYDIINSFTDSGTLTVCMMTTFCCEGDRAVIQLQIQNLSLKPHPLILICGP